MRMLVCVLMLTLPPVTWAVPFEITGGTWSETTSGIRFNVFGDNFSVRGNDSVSFPGQINGVNYAQTDLQLRKPFTFGEVLAQRNNVLLIDGPGFQVFGNQVEREFSVAGLIIGGNAGGVRDTFDVFGAGLATLSTILNPDGSASSLVNTVLAFAPSVVQAIDAAVPEPSAWLLVMSGGVVMLLWRYRPRRTRTVYWLPWS